MTMKEDEIRKRSVFNRYLELVAEDVREIFTDRSTFTQIDCPACGGKNYQSQFDKTGFTYVLCQDCGTLFVNPRPPYELLMDFYTRSPSTSFWVNEFFKPVAEVRREKIFKPRAEYIQETYPQMSDGLIGDIGAGFGLFLEELGKLWPSARLVAIEPSPEMVAICSDKGLEVIPCAMEDVQGRDGQFDLLTSFELFEHLYYPDEFLKKAWQLLRPGGRLFLTTLNGEGFDIQILWEKSKSVAPPHHLNFFNPRSITRLIQANNFTVEKVDTPGQLDWDILQGMFLEEGVDPGRFWRLVAEHASPDAKSSLQTWISENGLSSHMRILAKKEV
jgi:2-polyprenyl-3-methyl-5-hydroxy-6-metoxy-1,4-benzoquinol methylase/ribosomal protein S27E